MPLEVYDEIGGNQTLDPNCRTQSVSLEEVFWAWIKEIADERQIMLFNLVEEIDAARRPYSNLSSALRSHVLDHYKRKSLASDIGSILGDAGKEGVSISAR